MKLYGFSRSSAAFRVRIAINLKGLDCEHISVNLSAGEQFGEEYGAINPQARVPTLVDDETVLFQSLAILEYLEETHPDPPFLPAAPAGRARARSLAGLIACDIHPLNNLAVLKFLGERLGQDREAVNVTWYHHWICQGFAALEAQLNGDGRFCHGDAPGLADICLVPQVFNARRYEVDLSPYPALMRIFDACMELEALDAAQPSRQADA